MPSKLSPHLLSNAASLRRFVEAGSPFVKLAGNFGPAQELLAINPELLLVGRLVEAGNLVDAAASGQAPEACARDFVERQRGQYQLNPLIKVWEGPNEPVVGGGNDPAAPRRMAWLAAFEAERLRLLADLGLRGVVGNFSVGTPDLSLWPAFLPAVDAARRFQGYLGLHEYGSPFMWSLTGRYQIANCSGGGRADEGDTGWTTLRYRKAYRQFLTPNGLGAVPLLITECGLDHIGLTCPGQSDGAWRTHWDYWRGHDGQADPIEYWRTPERDPERYYAEQLLWYDRELQKDSFVVGAAVFTVGAIPEWAAFNIDGTRVVEVLVDHLQASRTPAAPPAPQTIVVLPGPGARPAPAAVNLLVNAGFEEGQAYFADDTRERAVPAGWLADWAAPEEAPSAGQAQPYGLPFMALINSRALIPADRDRVFAGGVFCWKVSGTRAPFRVRLWQSLNGLTPGQTYRFTVNVLPDVLARTDPSRVYLSDPLASAVRLDADLEGQSVDSGWLTGQATPYGQYSRLTLDFQPPSGHVIVGVEVRCPYPLPLSAWYIDELSVAPV